MNFNNRSDFLPDILEKLNGLEYYLNDFSSTGITYYDVCDRYNVQIEDKTYSCVMFNDEISITQGLEENTSYDSCIHGPVSTVSGVFPGCTATKCRGYDNTAY